MMLARALIAILALCCSNALSAQPVGETPGSGFGLTDGVWLNALAGGRNYTYDSSTAATGTNKATAAPLPSGYALIQINTVPVGAGVALPSAQAGTSLAIYNNGANVLALYPSASDTINSGASLLGGAPAGTAVFCFAAQAGSWSCSYNTARTRLLAPLTLHADSSSGTDIPTCGLTTGAGACNSVNYAFNNILVPNYDTAGKPVTISFNNNDSTCVSIGIGWTGAGQLTIAGPGGSPPSIGFTCTGVAIGINAPLPAALFLTGFKVSGGAIGIFSNAPGLIVVNNLNFGTESISQINLAGPGSEFLCNSHISYYVTGGAQYHWSVTSTGALLNCPFTPVTMTGSPPFVQFAHASDAGVIQTGGTTYSGPFSSVSAGSAPYFATLNGLIDTAGFGMPSCTGANCLPGAVNLGGVFN